LPQSNVAERVSQARLLAGGGWSIVRRGLGWPARLIENVHVRAPERLVIAPQDIRTADPTVAADIYAGYFSFAGKVVNTHGVSPFELPAPSPWWAASLESFGWLRHLRAADTALARENARVLVDDWLVQRARVGSNIAWDAKVTARRLLAWVSQSPLILHSADRAFYRRFMRSLGLHAAVLQRMLNEGLAGEARLVATIALAELGLCSEGLPKLQRKGTKLLADELTRQVLGDGGHVARNPQTLVELLLDLLPLRQAYAARGLDAPPQLLNSIDRMLPMLRMFRLGDGSLALFNGMGATAPHVLATLLAYDDVSAAAQMNAPYSGYQRIEAQDLVLVMDTGSAPPVDFSERAHAGCLSFEMTTGAQRLIVNCGAPDDLRAAMRDAARATAAHSTLVVADTSSCHFGSGQSFSRWLEGRIISGPEQVTVSRHDDQLGLRLEAQHDGYVRRFGLLHDRILLISPDGLWIEGQDTLRPAGRKATDSGDLEYTVRFHLHPSVTTAPMADNTAIELTLPDGSAWLFRAHAASLSIEESIYFAGPEGVRAAEQIVVHARLGERPEVHWLLEKIVPPHG
jgi:uncharacterized heparinase superfamily protein